MATATLPTNLLTGSIQDLWDSGGFGQQSTIRGDNPILSWFQKIVPGLGSRLLYQIGKGNELEMQKYPLISNFLKFLTPGNQQARADTIRHTGQNAALSNAPQQEFAARKLGYGGTGVASGAIQSGFNSANIAANNYLSNLNSPEGQQQLLMAALGAINAGQQTVLPDFLSMTGPLSQDAQFRKQMAGKGNIFGTLGNLAGMYAGSQTGGLSSLFGGGGGGGIPGMDGSSGGFTPPVSNSNPRW